MTTGETPLFAIASLEHEVRAIIEPRRAIIGVFARQVIGASCSAEDDDTLWHAFRQREPALAPLDYLPLAHEIGFVESIRTARLQRLYRTHALRVPDHPPKKKGPPPDTPAVAAVFERVRAILAASHDVTRWVNAFVNQELFDDTRTAQQAAYDFARVPRLAARQARHLVHTWLHSEDTTLLFMTTYPYQAELARIRAQAHEVVRQGGNAIDLATLLQTVRTDVVCVAQALQSSNGNNHDQTPGIPCHALYDESLWHQLPHSAYRTRYQERVPDTMRQNLIQNLATLRMCNVATATQLLNSYIHHRLSDLIAWRCHQQQAVVALNLERGRIRRAAEYLTAGLPSAAQQTILSRLDALQDAADAMGIALRFRDLVVDLPGSRVRRREQHKRLPRECIETFATTIAIERSSATSLVKRFIVYGPLGLLPIREWRTLLHPALWSYLHLHKLGRLERVLNYPRLTDTYNAYARVLNCPSLPQQMVTGICNHFPKDTYYDGGDGEATAGVPQRKSLKLTGVARLHEEWLVVAVPLTIDLVDHSLRSLTAECIALCVFDCGSERAVTCCVYAGRTGMVEVGLTLYDAIWHPHNIEWPLRGLPETILLPEPLAQGDLTDIREAAYWMHASVETVSATDMKKILVHHPFLKGTIAALRARYQPAQLTGRRRAPQQQMTVQDAQTTIRAWLLDHDFTQDHRIEHAHVPLELREQGYIMPGPDTIVAGYLLPVIARDVPTVRDGVEYQGYVYHHPDAGIEPGYMVTIRALQQGNRRPQIIFATYGDPPGLRYLELAGRI